jgi:hypothetical protein
MGKVIIICANCKSSAWVCHNSNGRNSYCSICGKMFCAKNREYKYIEDDEANIKEVEYSGTYICKRITW